MHLDLDRVRANAEKATTDDLLERVTVFRDQMEPEAVELIEQLLWRRGVGPEQVAEYGQRVTDVIVVAVREQQEFGMDVEGTNPITRTFGCVEENPSFRRLE